jgi:hypothetical protein
MKNKLDGNIKDIIMCFTGDKERDMDSPFYENGYTYATDGIFAIAVNGKFSDETYDLEINKRLPHIHAKLKFQGIEQYIDIKYKNCNVCTGTGCSKLKECRECSGYGFVNLKNEYSHYETQCDSCDGEGLCQSSVENGDRCSDCLGTGFELKGRMDLFNRSVEKKRLYLCNSLNNCEWSSHGERNDLLMFKFDYGIGWLMPYYI